MLKDQHNLHKLSVNVHMTVKERKRKGNNILLQIFNIYIYLGAHHLWTTYEKWPAMPSQLTGRRQTPSEQRCFPTMYIKCLQGELQDTWHESKKYQQQSVALSGTAFTNGAHSTEVQTTSMFHQALLVSRPLARSISSFFYERGMSAPHI